MTPYKDILPPERVANLRKLAAYLRTVERSAFDMQTYARDSKGNDIEGPSECGSVCCAVGSGVKAGIPVNGDLTWQGYSRRVFLNPYHDGTEGSLDEDAAWEWCFCASWKEQDNTPEGAADRIDWLLDNGLPDDAEDQRYGYVPLCYREVVT